MFRSMMYVATPSVCLRRLTSSAASPRRAMSCDRSRVAHSSAVMRSPASTRSRIGWMSVVVISISLAAPADSTQHRRGSVAQIIRSAETLRPALQISNLKFQIRILPSTQPPWRRLRLRLALNPSKPRRTRTSCTVRAEPLQRAQVFDDAVLACEAEEEFESRAHLLVKLEADVLAQVADEFRARSSEFTRASGGDLFGACESFVARGGEVNLRDSPGRALARHPHREDEAEAGVLAPERRHVVNAEALAREGHRRVADDERGVVRGQHLFEIRRRLFEPRRATQELPEDDLDERGGSPRRSVERDRLDLFEPPAPRREHDAVNLAARADADARHDDRLRQSLVLDYGNERRVHQIGRASCRERV